MTGVQTCALPIYTYENGKLKECPVCHNEDTNIDGNYCQICGSYIINKCPNQNCDNYDVLPSNARYCPICGESSTFYNANILKVWDYKEYKNNSDGFMNIPDGIDEELPFH